MGIQADNIYPITPSMISTSLATSTLPTISTTVPSTETSTPTTSPQSQSSQSSQINTGAVTAGIVGGVAGVGIVGIVAFLLRLYIRRRAASLHQEPRASSYSYGSGTPEAVVARNQVPQELDCHDGAQPPRYELGAVGMTTQPGMRVTNRV